jgi:hypothetical protein
MNLKGQQRVFSWYRKPWDWMKLQRGVQIEGRHGRKIRTEENRRGIVSKRTERE